MKLTKSKKSRAVETRRTNDLTVGVILRQLCRTYRPDYVLTTLTDVIDNEKF